MRTYPVDVIIQATSKAPDSTVTIPYIVKVEANSRDEARVLAKQEMLDFLEEKSAFGTVDFNYKVIQVSLQRDPYITRADKPSVQTIQKTPNVMGIPNN